MRANQPEPDRPVSSRASSQSATTALPAAADRCPTGRRPLRHVTETTGSAIRDQGTIAALLVDAREAARILSVSPRKLWAMTFEDQPGLPYIRCGRLVRYPVADLQRWIESQRRGACDEPH